MSVLQRNNALVNNWINLVTRFYETDTQQSLVDIDSITRVEIYPDDPRVTDSPIIQTILSDGWQNNPDYILTTSTGQTTTGFTRLSVGTYSYNSGPFIAPGKYWERVIYVPSAGQEEQYTYNTLVVRQVTGISSLGAEVCELHGTVVDSSGEPLTEVKVKINRSGFVGEKDSRLVSFKPKIVKTDSNGRFSIHVQTEVEFSISIPEIGYRRIFVLPNNSISKDITELDSFLQPPVDNPGEANNFLGEDSNNQLMPSSTGNQVQFQNEINTPIFTWDKTS